MSKELNDESLMPFGKEHKGKKMEDVPASYLLWLWSVSYDDYKAGLCKGSKLAVMAYIEDNLDVLEQE